MRKARDVAHFDRKEQRLDDLDRVERAISKLFSSQQDSLRSGLQSVFRSEVYLRSVAADPSDGPVESLDVKLWMWLIGREIPSRSVVESVPRLC